MKLFFILILYAFANVLTVDVANYKENVFVANLYTEQALNAGVLPEIIKGVVCGNRHTMGELAIMFVVPERADPDHLVECTRLQVDLRKEIHVAFYNLQVTQAKKPVPNRISYILKNPSVKGLNFENADLLHFGAIRRKLTQDVIKSVVIDTSIKKETQLAFEKYCLLMGLISCTEGRDYFIIDAVINDDEECVLTNYNKVKITYHSVEQIVEHVKILRQQANLLSRS
ncbi:uncharacterized protein LOC126835128 [Adelges cooleyi]|uniref:uncharacterized protein LOC126835128 n=1 Tax=Adelges cooleyi TaxID=133065 RepID=UPI00217F5B33|nr:uncharacterized protein LOC126835128 [Adelges cooleyi]